MRKTTLLFGMVFMFLMLGLSGMAMAYTISDDLTGGDCQLFGLWNSTTKTCTLTADVADTISLAANVVLDGNGHTVSGPEYGISGGTNNTIKNATVISRTYLKIA